MSRAPLREGGLRVVGRRIVQWVEDTSTGASGSVVDLGDVVLLPRLVNAHTHLEFSDVATPIGTSGMELADWIGQVIAARGQADDDHRAKAIALGIAESAAAGVGLIGDIATPPCRYESRINEAVGTLESPHPRVVSFAEIIGLSPQRADERFDAGVAHGDQLGQSPSWTEFGVSPHAPYSTPLDLIDRCVRLAASRDAPLAMHVAESPEERRLVRSGSGRFAEVLRSAGLWREGLFPWPAGEPFVELVERLAAAPRVLLIHGNDLTDQEIAAIRRHRHVSVVYCPRTHAFFGHRPHPVDRLIEAGVRVALGTDSRASNPDLNLWREVQFLLRHRPDLEPYAVLRMATESGGVALSGPATDDGTIRPGVTTLDDLVAIPSRARTIDQVWRDCAEHDLECNPAFRRA